MNTNKKAIYLTDNTRNGLCSNCGECCSDLLHLSTKEIVEIDKFLKKNKVKRHNDTLETKHYTNAIFTQ